MQIEQKLLSTLEERKLQTQKKNLFQKTHSTHKKVFLIHLYFLPSLQLRTALEEKIYNLFMMNVHFLYIYIFCWPFSQS